MNERSINPPEEPKAELRRNQLIDAALAVFAEKGFATTTVKELSEAAGVAQGLMYHYFNSKEGLLEAVIERHSYLPQLRRILARPCQRAAQEVLLEVAKELYTLLEQKEDLVRILLHESRTNPKVLKISHNLHQEVLQLLAEYLAARESAGELRPHDSDVVARCLVYTVPLLYLTQRIFPSSQTSAERFIPELVEVILNGIKA